MYDHLHTEHNTVITAKLITDVGTLFMQDSPTRIINVCDVLTANGVPVFDSQVINQNDLPEDYWTFGASRGNHMNLCHIYCTSKDVLRGLAYNLSDTDFLRDANVYVGKYARYRYRFTNGVLLHEYLDPGYINVPVDWL